MGKHFFAGNNTVAGFYSYFDHILDLEKADRRYILKGGPGVGKSSFMKKFAKFFDEEGASVEYIHCSTDSRSLDGIYVPDYRFAMVDGTAPHVIDSKLPGIVDEILDFGKYLDRDLLLENREEIIEINSKKSKTFKSGYRYFEMTGIILLEISNIYLEITDLRKKHSIELNLISELDELLSKTKLGSNPGKIRKMFSDSYTPNGYVSFVDKLSEGRKIWQIVCPNFKQASEILERIVSNVTIRGFNVEGYYHPLFPEKLQHIYIKELNLMIITTDREDQKENIEIDKIYPMYECLDKEKLGLYKSELDNNKKLLELLLSNGMNKFKEAKAKHKVLENIYIKSMDFDKVDILYEEIVTNIR